MSSEIDAMRARRDSASGGGQGFEGVLADDMRHAGDELLKE